MDDPSAGAATSQYCIAMTTVGSKVEAVTLARQVVDARLAACVQLVAIHSVYRWDADVVDADEQLLMMKTRTDRYAQLEMFVDERHPYRVPEIVRMPLSAGFAPYLAWIDDMTSG